MARIRTRISDLLGIDVLIIQAPMGWIARSQLAAAASEACGLGIIDDRGSGFHETLACLARCTPER